MKEAAVLNRAGVDRDIDATVFGPQVHIDELRLVVAIIVVLMLLSLYILEWQRLIVGLALRLVSRDKTYWMFCQILSDKF
jgi:hypothetical protein